MTVWVASYELDGQSAPIGVLVRLPDEFRVVWPKRLPQKLAAVDPHCRHRSALQIISDWIIENPRGQAAPDHADWRFGLGTLRLDVIEGAPQDARAVYDAVVGYDMADHVMDARVPRAATKPLAAGHADGERFAT